MGNMQMDDWAWGVEESKLERSLKRNSFSINLYGTVRICLLYKTIVTSKI